MRISTKLISVVVIVGLGYAAYTHFTKSPAAGGGMMAGGPPGGVPVEVAAVRSGESRNVLSAVGTLKANESAMLRPEVAGLVDAIHFTEGTDVSKGTLLISLDDRILAAEFKQAEAAYKLAQTTYNRARLLKEKGAGTISSFDNADAALSVARAQVDLARTKLEKTKISAPFDGTVGLSMVSPGDYVTVGQELASFQNVNPMKVDFALPENAARFAKTGQEISLQIDALPAQPFTGVVYAVDPQINEQNRNLIVRATVPNPNGDLKAGFFAHVSLLVGSNASAFFVPESAIMPIGSDNFVYVVGADKKVSMRKVVVGERKNGEVEILDGLNADENVVTAGHLKIRDGAEVSFGDAPAQASGAKP